MRVEVLALLTAFIWGVANVCNRKATETTSPLTGVIISSAMTALVLLVNILASVPLERLATPALPYFILAGFFAPGAARLLSFYSFARLGVSFTSIIMAGAPMWASVVAILVLGEQPSAPVVIGTLAIISGTVGLAGFGGPPHRWRRIFVLVPLAAGFAYGMRDVAGRQGLLVDNAPLVAGFITAVVSMLVMCLVPLVAGRADMRRYHIKGLLYYAIAGIAGGLSYIALFNAFARGEVVIVSPLVSTHPIFSVITARLVLGASEQLSRRSLIGGAIIVAGAILISIQG